jgi:hypothetical protein
VSIAPTENPITLSNYSFSLRTVYDTVVDVSTNAHFSFLAVANSSTTPINAKTIFNEILIGAFLLLTDAYVN